MDTTVFPREVALFGVVRNGGRRLVRSLNQLRRATSTFRNVHALIIESDSSDNTLETLSQQAKSWHALHYASAGRLAERMPLRTERIAHCRNIYLDELRVNPRYAAVSHVIVADLDRVCHDITAAALASCWGPRMVSGWSACMANQGDWYYDLWALRHSHWCPGDVWTDYRALLPLIGRFEALNVTQMARMIHIAPSRDWIEVDSAFGGLAIYRREALMTGRYEGRDGRGLEVCEHLSLHATMRASGHRLFINPAMINANKTSHGSRKGFWRVHRRRLLQWVKERFR